MSSVTFCVMAALAVAVLAACGVAWLQARRLRRIVDALDAFERTGHAAPLALGDARVGSDETARLAAQVERLADRLATQSAALAAATRQRSELLANVSHDLRTPLASMQGYLELLLLRQGELDGAEARNYLQTAVRQSERLGRLIGDLFELTRLEGDAARPEAEDFSLAELAHDVAQKFGLEATRRGVRLEPSLEPGAAASSVHADIALVDRLLSSLVENALRHTPTGGTVTISAEVVDGRAEVVVADTGEGIAAADLPGIFDHYERAARLGGAPGAAGHGGLGLAIGRRIVALHGGRLRIDSTVGRGTTVAFDLPLAGAATRAADAGAPAEACPPRRLAA